MLGHLVGQLVVFGWIDVQNAAGQDAQRATASPQCAAVRGRVNAACQAADDRQPRAGKASGQPFGLAQSVSRAMARTDNTDGQGVGRLQTAADEEQSRRIGNLT